jgi:hypothetical protein
MWLMPLQIITQHTENPRYSMAGTELWCDCFGKEERKGTTTERVDHSVKSKVL